MIRLISFMCSYSDLAALKRRFCDELPVDVMNWQPGLAMVREMALLPPAEHETDRWIFAWGDSPFSFGRPDPLVNMFLQRRRERIYYICVGDPSWESGFREHAVEKLGKIYQRADGTLDTDAIAAHAYFVNNRTWAGLEPLIEILS